MKAHIEHKLITIGEVAREIGIQPYLARERLRNFGLKPGHHRWIFTSPGIQLTWIRKILIKAKNKG